MSAQDTNPIVTTTITEVAPEAPQQSPMQALTGLAPFLLIFVVFYFLIIRPQDKKRRAQEELVGGVKKGEEVLTHSGIYATVSKVNDIDNTLELTIAKDVTIKVLKSSVADITSRKPAQKTPVLEKESEKKLEKKKGK